MGRVIDAFSQYFDGAGDPLINGWMKFLQSGTNNTLKTTFADSSETVENENPIQLDGEGRCPSIFGNGNYRVILYTNDELLNQPNEQVQMFDPVGGTSGTSNFQDWNASATYGVSDIVTFEGEYFRSKTNDNIDNEPSSDSQHWEQIDFIRYWNITTNYEIGENVFYVEDGYFYRSLTNNNLGNIPPDEPTEWAPLSFYDTSTIMNNPATENLDMADYEIQNAVMKNEAEVNQALGTISTNTVIDMTSGNSVSFTLGADLELSFTGWPASGTLGIFILHVTDGGAFTITWPVSVEPDGGSFPDLQTSGEDTLILYSTDNGTSIKLKRGWKEA